MLARLLAANRQNAVNDRSLLIGTGAMKLADIRLQHFRSYKDETILFDDYTCLVGPNGAGKSCVLTALNVFFRNTASCAINVCQLSEEDFYQRTRHSRSALRSLS